METTEWRNENELSISSTNTNNYSLESLESTPNISVELNRFKQSYDNMNHWIPWKRCLEDVKNIISSIGSSGLFAENINDNPFHQDNENVAEFISII